METIEKKIEKTISHLSNAYAPYSDFHVSALLEAEGGKQYFGCNVENAAYGACNCAERTAFYTAVAEGERSFSMIIIAGGKKGEITNYCPPCGICRQVMMEFCDPKSFEIILAKSKSDYKRYTLEDLLPHGFGCRNLV